MYLNSGIKDECCGCTACEHVCSIHAITMQPDEEGFLYPIKNLDKCTNCGLCEQVCKFTTPSYSFESPLVFAAYMKNTQERKKSSSGGVFYVIAKEIIDNGGVVFGAVMDENLNVHHGYAQTIDELQALRGSKYVQSDLQNCFSKIKVFLKSSRLVYFTGTPCQVAGLKGYLRKDYPTLLTSDLICHGVPSQSLFDKHIEYLKKKYSSNKISNYQFRNNEVWGVCEIFNFTNLRGVEVIRKFPTYELSPFLYSFMYAFTYRYSCYKCPFAKIPRQGDITLGDYWGVQKFHPEMERKNGVSLILLNNNYGKKFWNKIKDELIYVESNISAAAKYNGNLICSSEMPSVRKGIYEEIEQKGYAFVADSLFRSPRYQLIKIKLFLFKLIGTNNIQKIKNLLHK